jgi:hypothetical protein
LKVLDIRMMLKFCSDISGTLRSLGALLCDPAAGFLEKKARCAHTAVQFHELGIGIPCRYRAGPDLPADIYLQLRVNAQRVPLTQKVCPTAAADN